MGTFKIKILSILFIVCLGVIVYSNTFTNAFHYDDFPQIVHNTNIRDIHNLKAIWDALPSRFMTYYSFALNYHWGGLNLVGFHGVSLIIHIATSILAWYLALLILKVNRIALFAGMIFLVHPIQTEAINYIYQRGVLLVTFFYLGALILYIKARTLQVQQPRNHLWKVYYSGALLTALLSMLSKEMSSSLPLIILLCEAFFLKDGRKWNWKMVVPFFMIVLIIPLLTIHSLKIWELPKAAENVNDSGVTAGQYFLTQLRVKLTYLRLLFLPAHQSVVYDYSLSKSMSELPVVLSSLFLMLLLWGAVKLRTNFKIISFGIFWFFITLLPESSIFPINNLICEYRLYLPMVGFALFLSSAVSILTKERITLFLRFSVLLICVYSFIAYQRNAVWKDEFSLWDDAVRKAPNNQTARMNRGVYYQEHGDLDRALADYNMVIGLGPVTAVTLSNRGVIFKEKGLLDFALANFNLAIQINPSYVGTYVNRGALYASLNQMDLAAADFTKVIELDPSNAKMYINQFQFLTRNQQRN